MHTLDINASATILFQLTWKITTMYMFLYVFFITSGPSEIRARDMSYHAIKQKKKKKKNKKRKKKKRF